MAIINEKQDLTFLKWSHIRASSGTAGTFLKSETKLDGVKTYYKLSNYDSVKGIVGHECVNEIIIDRLLTILGVEHLSYDLIYADVEIDGRVQSAYICASRDFKKRGESKTAIDSYYVANAFKGESHYDFCVRNGWQEYIDTMIVIDFIILNRDRHGANIEVLRNSREHSLRLAPLFDHGLSLLYPCLTEEAIDKFDVLEDKPCNNYIGSRSCRENLGLIGKKPAFSGTLKESDREVLFAGLEGILTEQHLDRIWEMIYTRYGIYESI